MSDNTLIELNNELEREHHKRTRKLLTAKEASRYLAVSERTLFKFTKQGAIPSVRIGRCVRYDLSDLEKFIEKAKGLSH